MSAQRILSVFALLLVVCTQVVLSYEIQSIFTSSETKGPSIVLTSDHHSETYKKGYSVVHNGAPHHPAITPFITKAAPSIELRTEEQVLAFAQQHNVSVSHVRSILALQEMSKTNALPFEVETDFTETPLEISVTLRPKLEISLGVKKIRLAVGFPACGNVFEARLDLTDWGGELKKIWKHTITLELPRVCVSDFNIDIPFTTLCMKVANLAVLQRGVVGDLMADLSVGFATFHHVSENNRLWRFKVGHIDDCYTILDQQTCVKATANSSDPNSASCGWCSFNKQCLTARSDNKADLCKLCPRCNFFVTSSESGMKGECMNKEACGWCESDKMCHPGDTLGPFNPKVKCDPEKVSQVNARGILSYLSVSEVSNSTWVYNTVATKGKTTKKTAAVVGFLCVLFGFLFGLGLGVTGTVGSCFIFAKKKLGSAELKAKFLSR